MTRGQVFLVVFFLHVCVSKYIMCIVELFKQLNLLTSRLLTRKISQVFCVKNQGVAMDIMLVRRLSVHRVS